MTGEDDEARRPFDVHYGRGVKGDPWRYDASTDHDEASGTVNNHLPECIYTPGYFDSEASIWWDGKPCICHRLRACEQRSYALGIEVGKHDGWVAGHAAGVQAVRDAVAALPGSGTTVPGEGKVLGRADALAAIDALRGESND